MVVKLLKYKNNKDNKNNKGKEEDKEDKDNRDNKEEPDTPYINSKKHKLIAKDSNTPFKCPKLGSKTLLLLTTPTTCYCSKY